MARDRLVDRQQAEHAVVVLAEVRLALLLGPFVGHRRDREERLLAFVERAGRAEHRAAERAEEDRCPLDLEWFVGQSDQVRLGAEGLDPSVLRAAEIEQVVRLRMLERDGIQHAADEDALVVRHRLPGAPRRPEIARQAHHLRTDRAVLAFRAGHDPFRRERLRAHRVTHLGREQVPPKPALALAGRKDHVAEMGLEAGHGRARGLSSGNQARLDRGHRWVGGCSSPRGRQGLVDQRADPRKLLQRRLRLEPPDRTPGITHEPRTRGVEDGGKAREAPRSRGEAIRQGRELAGIQREQPVADQVDPVQRVPCVFTQLRIGEPAGLELADQEVAIDDLVRGQVGHRPEFGKPAIREGGLFGAAGFRQVGPAVVVVVLADGGGKRRVEPEEVGQEIVEAAGEVGHARESTVLAGRGGGRARQTVRRAT